MMKEKKNSIKFRIDPKGYFLIKFTDNKIHVGHFSKDKKLIKQYKSRSADDLYEKIIRDEAVTYFEHAAYLGKELKKAEIALQLKLPYIQDKELIFKKDNKKNQNN